MKFEKSQTRYFDSIMIYFWWNIWKKRIRRTFHKKLYNQDKWLCYARRTFSNMIWGQIVPKVFTNLVLMLVLLVLELGRFLHGCCCPLCSCA